MNWKMEADRRGVFPNLSQKLKSAEFWEKLSQPSQESDLSGLERYRDDLKTFLHNQHLGGSEEPTDGVIGDENDSDDIGHLEKWGTRRPPLGGPDIMKFYKRIVRPQRLSPETLA